jgi:hypothetical protein
MTYQIIYLMGKTKLNNTYHEVEVEATNAFYAINNFRTENKEGKVFVCIKKPMFPTEGSFRDILDQKTNGKLASASCEPKE